jgi:predicted dehydrogenase
MKRRRFLKITAGSAAVALGPSVISAVTLGRDGRAPSQRVNVALIGAGGMGCAHLDRLLADPRARVVALCDVDRQRLAHAAQRVAAAYGAETADGVWRGVFTTTDFREALVRAEVDVVFLALPDHWHALPLIAAARAGKHVYAEKPLALTIPEGLAMRRAIAETGVVCQIGSQQRSGKEFVRAVELVRNGFLGKLTRIQVGLPGGDLPARRESPAPAPVPAELDYDRWLGPAPWAPYTPLRTHYDFRWVLDYSGGQLTDWIGHHFDIAAWAAGVSHESPIAIKNATAEFARHPIYNTAIQFAFEAHYADGTMIEVASTNRPGVRLGVSFAGSEGALFVTRGRLEPASLALRDVRVPATGFSAHDHTSHHENFFDCVFSRAKPHCPIDEAHHVASVAHLANLAFRTGRRELRWDFRTQQIIGADDAARLLARQYRAPWKLSA